MKTTLSNWLYNTVDFICKYVERWLTSNLVAFALLIDRLVMGLGRWAVKGQTNLMFERVSTWYDDEEDSEGRAGWDGPGE